MLYSIHISIGVISESDKVTGAKTNYLATNFTVN